MLLLFAAIHSSSNSFKWGGSAMIFEKFPVTSELSTNGCVKYNGFVEFLFEPDFIIFLLNYNCWIFKYKTVMEATCLRLKNDILYCQVKTRRKFYSYAFPACFITLSIVDPNWAGLSVTTTPAEFNALILSSAVPFPPAIIAPACPIRY